MGRAKDGVAAVHGREMQPVLVLAPGRRADDDEPLRAEIVRDEVVGQVAPPEPSPQHHVLRVEVGDAPRA